MVVWGSTALCFQISPIIAWAQGTDFSEVMLCYHELVLLYFEERVSAWDEEMGLAGPWVSSEQASKEMRLCWALKTGTELDKIFVFSVSLEQCLKVIQLTEKNGLS